MFAGHTHWNNIINKDIINTVISGVYLVILFSVANVVYRVWKRRLQKKLNKKIVKTVEKNVRENTRLTTHMGGG